VAEGTEAMSAFQSNRFDDTLNKSQNNEIKKQLLLYLKLDTMTMVKLHIIRD
jgi:hypothetical protein